MKKILLSLFGLVVLAVAALLVVPGFIDWNSYKADITEQIRAATGRDVVIEGDLNIRLLPSPAVMANDVRIANLKGASSAQMAHFRVLDVRVALAPLLGGTVQVEKVRLVDPLIALEVLPDGRRNWDFQSQTPTGASKTGGEGGNAATSAGGDVQLDAFAIENGTLIYRDGQSGASHSIEGVNVDVSARSLSGPFEAEGALIFKGLPISFEVAAGRLDSNNVPITLEAHIKPANVTLVLSAGLSGLNSDPVLEGDIRLSGPGTGLAALGGLEGPVPGVLGETVSLSGRLRADTKGASLEGLSLRLAGTEAKGRLGLALAGAAGVPTADLDLKVARINLGDWLGRKAVTVKPLAKVEAVRVSTSTEGRKLVAIPGAGEPDKAASAAKDGAPLSLPKGVGATLTLGIDAITYRNDVISQARMAVELANGEVTVSQLSAILPGVTNVAAFGFVTIAEGGAPAFEGDLEVGSSDLRGLFRWFGVEDIGVPSDRLRAAALASKLRVTPREIQLPGIRLNVDQSKVSGGVTLALRKRLAFGADLSIDRIDLDRYVTPPTVGASSPSAGAKGGEEKAAPVASEVGVLAAISTLDAFDTNLKVAVDSLTHQGRVYRKVALDSTLYNGELSLRKVSIGDVAGASLSFSGGLAGLGGLPEMRQATFDLNAPDPVRLARAFGVSTPPILGRIGAIQFTGAAEGSFLRPRLDATLKAAGGEVLVKGALSTIPLTSLFDGRLAIRHEDFDALLRRIGAGYRPAGTLGGIDVAATVKVDPDAVSVSAIHGQIGPVPLEGRIDVGLAGARTNIKADLQAGIVPVKSFLPAAGELKKPTGGSSGGTSASAPSGTSLPVSPTRSRPVSDRWSTDPIDFSVLRDFDGDVSLSAKGITFDTYSLENAILHGTLKKGVFSMDRIAGTFFGGAVGGTARVDAASAMPQMQGALSLKGMNVAEATKAVSGKSLAAGRMDANLEVTSAGDAVARMVSTLGGGGSFALTNLDVREGSGGSVLSGVIGVLASLNNVVSGILPSGDKEKGLADVTSQFTMKDGVATLQSLSFVSPEGKGQAQGTVDIAGWWVNASGEIALPDTLLAKILARNTSKRSLPFTVQGALDKPDVVLKTASLGSGLGKILDKAGIGKVLGTGSSEPATAPAPSSGGSVPPPQVPPDQRAPAEDPSKTIKPEDVIKGILRGVIQGQ